VSILRRRSLPGQGEVGQRVRTNNAATVTALVIYAVGTEGRVKVPLRKGEPAWLMDWRATQAL